MRPCLKNKTSMLKWGPGTSSTGFLQEFVENAEYQALPQTHRVTIHILNGVQGPMHMGMVRLIKFTF